MPAALSTDLRRRVVAHFEKTNATRETLAQIFSIGPATAYRWVNQWKKTGSLEPLPTTLNRAPMKIPSEELSDLRIFVEEKPDRTLQQLCDDWFVRNAVRVDDATMHRALVRAGLSLKKRRYAPRKGTETTS